MLILLVLHYLNIMDSVFARLYRIPSLSVSLLCWGDADIPRRGEPLDIGTNVQARIDPVGRIDDVLNRLFLVFAGWNSVKQNLPANFGFLVVLDQGNR